MNEFTLRIKMGNDAMQTPEDVAASLRDIANRLDWGMYRRSGEILDYSGRMGVHGMIVKGDMFDDGPNHPCRVVGFRDKVRGDIFDTADAPRRKGGHRPYVVFVEQFGDYRMGTTRYENVAKRILEES